MVFPLVLVALGISFLSFRPGQRGVEKRKPGALPPAVFFGVFLLATVLFIVLGLDFYTMIAAAIAVSVVFWQRKGRVVARTQRKQAASLSEFLGMCAGNLRAGSTVVEAMDYALNNVPASKGVTDLLHIAARRARSGGGGSAVLIDAKLQDLQRLGALWETSEKYGIPLVALLEQLRSRIDTRLRHQAATNAALQGPQATAVILSFLPIAGVVMGMAMGANPIGVLTGGGIGGIMLVVGVGLVALGFVLTKKILESASSS